MESAIAHDISQGEQRTIDVAASSISFDELNLKRFIMGGLRAHKFQTPTKIQAAAIPMALCGMDLMVQSKSGTGKTVIYVLAALQLLDPEVAKPQVLVVVPTRELAIQVEDHANGLSFNKPEYRSVSYIGGTDAKKDRKRMAEGRIVIGTPGRLLHLMHNNVFNTSGLKLLVLDEADQLFGTESMQNDVHELLLPLWPKCQIIACSATYPNALDERLALLMHKPILVSNSERATVLLGIRQFVYLLPEPANIATEMQNKVNALLNIFSQVQYEQCIIFSSTQVGAEGFYNLLNRLGIKCDLMSGGMKQTERLETFQAYRHYQTRIVVSTDVMARGVDSSHANLIINLDPPRDFVTYVHRIGRAGRFGSKGISITFTSWRGQVKHFKRILTDAGTGLSVLKFPYKKRVGFNFFNYDSYDFPYFLKMEAHEQSEEELQRIKRRCTGKPKPRGQKRQNLAKQIEKQIKPVKEAKVQYQEKSKPQQEQQSVQAQKAEGIEEQPCEAANQPVVIDIEPLNSQQNNELVEKLTNADQHVEYEPQETATLALKANATTGLNVDKETQINSYEQSALHKKFNTQIRLYDFNPKQDNCVKPLELEESPMEPIELTPSLEFPAAAPNSINTKTYCLAAPTDCSSTTLQPLGISNTVDDASSIISDSMENDYDSDASYSSFYSESDARVILSYAQVQKKRQKKELKRRKLIRHRSKLTTKLTKKTRKYINLDEETDTASSTLSGWETEKDEYKGTKVSKGKTGRQLVAHKKIDENTLIAFYIFKKFNSFQELKKSVASYIKKMTQKQYNQWVNAFHVTMQRLYCVDQSKIWRKSFKKISLPEIGGLGRYNSLMAKLKKPIVEEQLDQQPLLKLSVHVNQRLNIHPGIAAGEPNNNDDKYSQSSQSSDPQLQAIGNLSNNDSEDSDSDGGDSVEPYSSGFVESAESGSSGIDTSQYEDSDDDEDEDETSDDTETDTGSDSATAGTLTADSDENGTEHETDAEEEEDAETDKEDVEPEAGENLDGVDDDNDTGLVMSQTRWHNMFQMQYHFIANYVANYMGLYRPS